MLVISEKEAILICDDIECCWDEWGDLSIEKCRLLKRIAKSYPEIRKSKTWLFEEVDKRV